MSNLNNDEVEDEEPQPDEGDDTFAVGQGQVDVGAEPHLVVHPGDDHHVAHEAEQDHSNMGADDMKAFIFLSRDDNIHHIHLMLSGRDNLWPNFSDEF